MPRRWHFIRRLAWPLIIAALIVSASNRPRLASPEITNVDKVTHFAVYGLLATLVCRLGHGWRSAVFALVAVSAFGATDEWHQSFVPGRSSEVADWVADTLGAATAVMLYWGWAQYRRCLEFPLVRVRPTDTTTANRAGGDERAA